MNLEIATDDVQFTRTGRSFTMSWVKFLLITTIDLLRQILMKVKRCGFSAGELYIHLKRIYSGLNSAR